MSLMDAVIVFGAGCVCGLLILAFTAPFGISGRESERERERERDGDV